MSQNTKYYNSYGQQIKNFKSYAATGAPMYKNLTNKNGDKIHKPQNYINTGGQLYSNNNENKYKSIYVIDCKDGKKYIGETENIDKRILQHFTGNGSKVTQKFMPKKAQEIDKVPGVIAKDIEHEYTKKYIKKFGYENVRGGRYTNSTTLNNNYNDTNKKNNNNYGNYSDN